MFLTVTNLAKAKAKRILVRLLSEAGTGTSVNVVRPRLQEKLVILRYDPAACPLQRAEKDPFPVDDKWLSRFYSYIRQTHGGKRYVNLRCCGKGEEMD